MINLIDKTAVITGASSGIGAKIAEYLAEEGVNVVLVARRKDKLEMLMEIINNKEQGRSIAISADISKQTEVEQMILQAKKTFGNIDIYVNNAGLMLDAPVRNGKIDEWEQMIDVNIKGVLYGIHSVLPEMVENAFGHIVNIASVSGKEVTKNSTVYSATKFAVRAISMGLEKELARTGVRVTNISPGMVDTSLLLGNRNKEGTRSVDERMPLYTDDIARAVVYAVKQPAHVNVNELTVRPV